MLGEEGNADYWASKEDFLGEQDNLLDKLRMSLKVGTRAKTAKLKKQIYLKVMQVYIQMHQERLACQEQPIQH